MKKSYFEKDCRGNLPPLPRFAEAILGWADPSLMIGEVSVSIRVFGVGGIGKRSVGILFVLAVGIAGVVIDTIEHNLLKGRESVIETCRS